MSVETFAATAIGQQRDHNEDSVHAGSIDGVTVLAVADGMGGHSAGDVASQEALDAFVRSLDEHDLIKSDPADALTAATAAANTRVHELAAEDPELEGMGTTLIAGVVVDGDATLVNVGDSRGYHVTLGGIEQVTTDQSLVQELVEQGTIDPDEADDHPQKNVLSQALGTAETVEPDIYNLSVDGTILLCSDGLSDEVAESTIRKIVTTADSLDVAASELIDRANEVDGSDNVSVVLGQASGE